MSIIFSIRLLATVQFLLGFTLFLLVILSSVCVFDCQRNPLPPVEIQLFSYLSPYLYLTAGVLGGRVNETWNNSLRTKLFYISNVSFMIFVVVKSAYYNMAGFRVFDSNLLIQVEFVCGILESFVTACIVLLYMRVDHEEAPSGPREQCAEIGDTVELGEAPPHYDDVVKGGVCTVENEGLPSYSDIVFEQFVN